MTRRIVERSDLPLQIGSSICASAMLRGLTPRTPHRSSRGNQARLNVMIQLVSQL
jgi:hypothetical protein